MSKCNLVLGQWVNITGRLFCKQCGAVMSQGGITAVFAGHDHGFDMFHFLSSPACPWCGTVNDAAEKPCDGEPAICIGVLDSVEIGMQK